MKLRCVLVLALVPLVTTTPHGYGVKGGAGAAAKAEAVAGAGAFAGVPLAIPSGAGYSGSFAKSSSSSFAASSASSSASSFSFSGSGITGTGANGLPGVASNGAGTEGCDGNCKSGNKITPDTTGAGSNNQVLSGAKAAAGAGAVAISGAPYGKNGYQAPCSSGDCASQKTSDCVGSSCGDTANDSKKCVSGECEPSPQGIDSKEKCVAGQCSPSSPETAPSYDSNDIQVKPVLKPLDDGLSMSPPSSASTLSKPTTYLTTPKEESPCTSPDCAPLSRPPGDVYDKEKPSSYNVPILGPNYGPSTNKKPCSTGDCNHDQPGPSAPRESGSICASGNCQSYPNNQNNPGSSGAPSSYKPGPSTGASFAQPSVPSYTSFANTGAVAGANAIGNYGTPKPTNKKLPPYTGGFGGPAGILKPNDFSAPNKNHVSDYKPISPTGPNVQATAPCAFGNCGSRPTQPESNVPTCSTENCKTSTPVFTSGVSSVQLPSQPSDCSSGNCGISPESTPIQHSPPVSSNPTTSSGNFGGPAGILRPNDYSKPSPKPTSVQGSYNPPTFPSVQHDQTNEPSTGQYRPGKPSVCSYGNCPVSAGSTSVQYSPPEPSYPTTPTENFGGPAGILRPNDYSKPSPKPTPVQGSNNPPSVDQTKEPSTGQYQPAKPSSCSTGNYPVSPGSTSVQYSPPELSYPNTPTGNFGGPAGIIGPNDYSKPSPKPTPVQGSNNPPSVDQTNVPSTGQYRPSKPSICSTGNCPVLPGSTPIQHSPPEPSYPTGNFGGPAGILKPNDYSKPSPKPTPVQGSNNPPSVDQTIEPSTGQYRPAKPSICSTGNCPVLPGSTPIQHSPPELSYPTENFGGPAGILKPNDYSKPSPKPTSVQGSYNPPSVDQTNEPSSGEYRPGKPSICSTGNCPVLPGSILVQHSPPQPSYPFTPTGNFVGPAGISKPNDYSKPPVHIPKPMPAQGSFSPPNFASVQHDQTNEPSTVQYKPAGASSFCSSGNCGSLAPPSGPHNLSKPNTPQIPSAGFGGPVGILKPNDFTKPLIPSHKQTPTVTEFYNPPGLSSPQHDQLNKPNTSQYNPAGPSDPTVCSSGNCAYQPSPPHVGPLATAQTNQGYPTLCSSAICGPQPTQTSAVTTGSYHPTYCTSGNCRMNSQPSSGPSTAKNPSSTGLNQHVIPGSDQSTFQSSLSSSKYGPSISLSQTYSSTGAAATGSFNPLCSSGKCKLDQPLTPYDSGDTKPASSANTYNPQPCASGICGSYGHIPNVPSASAGEFSPAICTSGNCGVNSLPGHSIPHYNQPGAPNIAVGAVASASAVAYTGGFGGPPGLLKPYDGGKLNSLLAGFGPKGAASYGPAVQSSNGKSINGAGAQASAVAGATAGVYGGNGDLGGYSGQESGNESLKGGCTSGCGSQGGTNFGHNGGLDGFGALSAAGASAKSVVGTIGGEGAGAYGQAGSFASSSASAHASAGAAAKGGYGRR